MRVVIIVVDDGEADSADPEELPPEPRTRRSMRMNNPITPAPQNTPNVVVQSPHVRKIMNVVLGAALVILPSCAVLDAASPELDFASWLVPATSVTSFLAGVFGLAVITPNIPRD